MQARPHPTRRRTPLPEKSLAGVNPNSVPGSDASFATCKSLHDVFASLPEPRARSGMRYPQAQLLGIMTLALVSALIVWRSKRRFMMLVTIGGVAVPIIALVSVTLFARLSKLENYEDFTLA